MSRPRARGTGHGRLLVRVLGVLAAAAVAVTTLPACEKIDRNMWDNPAFRPQEEPVRLPPADSVPTKGISRVPAMGEAAGLKNPVTPSDRARLEGKALYGIHCAPCHGEPLRHGRFQEWRESGHQSRFEAHSSRKQISREHAPGALTAANVVLTGNFVDHFR